MTATMKTVSALALAAVLSLALFLSPVGISSAQDEADDQATEQNPESTEEDGQARPDRGDRAELTDEEREALQAEREAQKATFLQTVADELGVTTDQVVAAFKTAAIEQVQAKLDAGDITEERAAEIIEKIEASEGLPGGRVGGGRGHHHGPRGGGAPAGDAAADGGEI